MAVYSVASTAETTVALVVTTADEMVAVMVETMDIWSVDV